MIRVLIADDHTLVREGLRRLLSAEAGIDVVGEVADGGELLATLAHTPVDVVLLDVTMPGPGFQELVSRIRRRHPGTRVLVVSAHPEGQFALRALAAGASGYLTKHHSPEALAAAVRTVHRGEDYITGAVARLMAERLRGGAEEPQAALSGRELQILRMLGSGLSQAEIARQLSLSPKTISTYRSRLMAKMGFTSNADMVRYVVDHDLLL